MKQRRAPEHRELQTRKSAAEIPPPQNRPHLTEPSWIESMIHFTGVYLGKEEEEAEDTPPRTEAA
jgi:hypothetical protein